MTASSPALTLVWIFIAFHLPSFLGLESVRSGKVYGQIIACERELNVNGFLSISFANRSSKLYDCIILQWCELNVNSDCLFVPIIVK